MNKWYVSTVVVLSFILMLVSCSEDNGASGGGPQPSVGILAGTYQPLNNDLGVVRATITIDSDNSGNVTGEVEIDGAVACFTNARFSSSDSASSFDPQSRTGVIEASNGSSKALLYFSVSADYIYLDIQGGKSKLMRSNGETCLVLEDLTLRKKAEVPGR